jgi:ribosome-binding factor A
VTSRLDKVADLIAENISEIIEHQLNDPRKGLITVTGARVSGDLRHAQVFVTTLGDEAAKREMVRILEHASGFIRAELGRRIRLKFVPELAWRIDNTVEDAQKIDDVLRRLRAERGEDGESTEGLDAPGGSGRDGAPPGGDDAEGAGGSGHGSEGAP